MHTISLLFGVHAHQPVGNFREVIDDAHRRCYRPFLHTLHRFPEFRFAVHFSGWLLEDLQQRYPADMALLKAMVERGQVELFGGGDTEPVLAVIPERDRLGQIEALSDRLERTLGQRPRGAWLTERVWEATVVPALADAGIGYVTVDDYHFLCGGKEEQQLNGYYSTEENGRRLDLFPISEALRYRLPFSPAHEAVAHIEQLADAGCGCAAVYFDDIEKFGIWPETYQWVYEKGWLEQFIQGVLASPRIVTERYLDYHQRARTRGVVYLPTTSYIEMNEWTLPVPAAHRYADLVGEAKQAGRFDRDKAFLRGGFWKNFFSRYPESNWLHKRMLGLSQRVADLPEKKQTPALRAALYRAQANDAYWHGLFGGLYLPHLRRAIYNALLELEAGLDRIAPRTPGQREDIDLDGHDELFLRNDRLQAVIRLDGSASLHEFDCYPLRHNFGDTLARQTEHYHRKLHLDPAEQPAHQGDGIASAHDRVAFKHVITPEDLATDAHGRTLLRDSHLPGGEEARSPDWQLRDASDIRADFAGHCGEHGLEKSLRLDGNRLVADWRLPAGMSGHFVSEIALAMPCCDGPAGRFVHRGQVPGGFGQPLDIPGLEAIRLEDEVLGGALDLTTSVPARLIARPHFTVSQSEAGFEKIMQALILRLEWPLDGAARRIGVSLTVTPA